MPSALTNKIPRRLIPALAGKIVVPEQVAFDEARRAWNLAIDALRLRRAVPMDPDDFAATALASAEHNPEDAVRRGDVRQLVRGALERLPDEQRRAVVLAAVYGRTALEISESEGIPLGTAKTRIRTALLRMRATVEQAEEVDDER